MTRWGAQFPVEGSAGMDATGSGAAGDDGEQTIDRAQLAQVRAHPGPAPLDGPAADDDVTISRAALEQLRRARRDSDADAFDDEETVSRAELDQRRGTTEASAATSPRRLRRDRRSAAEASVAAVEDSTPATEDSTPATEDSAPAAEAALDADAPADAYFRDASTIPYATLMSLRTAAVGPATDHGGFAAGDTTPSDVLTADENVATRSIRLPLPAAELARELDAGDDEEEVPEETLPAPVTHDVAVPARADHARGGTARVAPRTGDHRSQSASLDQRPVTGDVRPHDRVAAAVPQRRPRSTSARRRILVLSIVAVLAVATAVTAALSGILRVPLAIPLPGQNASAAAGPAQGPGAGHGETNLLVALADSPKDAAEVAADGGAEAVALAVVDFSADGSRISSVSLRPDTWVAIPEHGEGTLSDALALGGAEALRATMQDSLGIRIDHTIVITEPWLTGLALSGDLDIVNPSDVTTDRFTFPSGPLTLSPSTAADYLESDPHDVLRQQAVLDGAARLLIARGVPSGTTMDSGLVVLPAFDADAIERLTTQLRQVNASGIVYGVAATSDAERDSRAVATLDGKAWQDLRAAFTADDVASHLSSGTSR